MSQFFLGLVAGLFVGVLKGVFMLAGWVLQALAFVVWKLTTVNQRGSADD